MLSHNQGGPVLRAPSSAIRTVAFDTETYLIEPGNLAPKLVCLSYHDEEGCEFMLADEGIEWLREALMDPEVILVGHNVAFDFGVCVAKSPDLLPLVFQAYEEGRVRDTMIRDKLLLLAQGRLSYDFKQGNRRTKFSLAEVVRRRLSVDISEGKSEEGAWRFRYAELDGVPLVDWPTEAIRYALNDAMWTWKVHDNQSRRFVTEGAEYAGDWGITNEVQQTQAAWGLHLMSVWGIRTDKEAVERLEAELRPKVEEMRRKLLSAGLMKRKTVKGEEKLSKNLAAIREKVTAAYSAQGREAPRTDKGSISTSRQTLVESGDSLLMEFGAETNAEKLLTTFLPVLQQGTEVPLNPGYDVLKESGRTSSFKPNIQQLPRAGGVRECFVPREGNAFIAADYATLELCCLAQICLDLFGYSKMGDAINADNDLHLEMGATLMGITYHEALMRRMVEDKEVAHFRQLSKCVNFGYPGGLGAETFTRFAKATYGVDIGLEEASSLKEQWLGKWPEMRDFFRHVGGLSSFGNDFTIVQHRSKRQRGGTSFTAGCNTLFQGLAADGTKEAIWRVAKECYGDPESPLFGARPVAFIHDEILLECPVETIHEVAERLCEVMVEAMKVYTPDVDISVEAAAMLRWYKGASPKWEEERLVLWEPE